MLTSKSTANPLRFPTATDPEFAEDELRARELASSVAQGARPADLVLQGGRVVDVFNQRIFAADIAVAGDRIALIGDVESAIGTETQVIDCSGRTLIPGLIEPHFHIGGSQLAVERLAEILVRHGTTALSTCFYEVAIISGVESVEAQLERLEGSGLDVLLAPFVASLGQGDLGSSRSSFEDVRRLLANPRTVELREWNVASHSPALREIYLTATASGSVIGGHLEGLSGAQLQASVALGCRTDHEVSYAHEALEKIANGLIVQIRQGTGARDLEEVTRAITEFGASARNFSLTADQQELWSLQRDGHLDDKLRRVVAEGVSPVDAVTMATINSARSLGIDDRFGALAPGYFASIVAVDDLRNFTVEKVISRGRLVVDGGEYLLDSTPEPYPAEETDTIRVARPLTAEDFVYDVGGDGEHDVRVIGVTPGSLLTEELQETVTFTGGIPETPEGLNMIAVFDRHQASGRVGLGLIRGIGVRDGAFAATPTPGQVNPMVVGTNRRDMEVAANRLIELKGGIIVVKGGEIVAEVALPVYGLLNTRPVAETARDASDVARSLAEDLGCPDPDVITNAAFATIPRSIPAFKVCDYGLVRVFREGERELVPLKV